MSSSAKTHGSEMGKLGFEPLLTGAPASSVSCRMCFADIEVASRSFAG